MLAQTGRDLSETNSLMSLLSGPIIAENAKAEKGEKGIGAGPPPFPSPHRPKPWGHTTPSSSLQGCFESFP